MRPSFLQSSIRLHPGVSLLLTLTMLAPYVQAAPKKDAANTESKPVSPVESAMEAAQKETERRKADLARSREQVTIARGFLKSGDFESALKAYTSAKGLVPEIKNPPTAFAPILEECKDGIRDASLELAKVRISEGRYPVADQILRDLLAQEPNCRAAQRIRAQLATPGYYNKTITPIFRADLEQVKQWLLEGQGFYDSGRYDLAMKRADQVLSKDPYNVAARKLQEACNNQISDYGSEAYNEARSRAMAKVERTWASPVRRFGAASTAAPSTTKVESSQVEKLRRKVNEIVIDEIQFTGLPLSKVASVLSEKSAENDKSNDSVKGVVVVVQGLNEAGPSTSPSTISVSALTAPTDSGSGPLVTTPKLPPFKLSDLLTLITGQTGTKWTVTDSFVTIVPLSASTEKVIAKTWPVSPQFFSSGPKVNAELSSGGLGGGLGSGSKSSGSSTGKSRVDAKEVLTSQGVKFDASGSTATYNARAQTLTVLNTPDQLEVVDSLVRDADQLAPTQVEIQAKFVEFSQNNMKELSFDWLLGQSNVGKSSRVFSGGGTTGTGQVDSTAYPFMIPNGFANAGSPVGVNPMTAGNRSGRNAMNANAVDALLAGGKGFSGAAPAAFALAGAFTDPQFQLVIRAINQSKGVDLLSSPSITAKSGNEALIEIIREFIYPDQFTPPQIPQSVGGGTAGGGGGATAAAAAPQSVPVTPTTPSSFKTVPIGVRLPVTPTIQGDNYTVDLELTPEVTEFEGFINYGSPIQTVSIRSTLPTALGAAASTPTAVTLTENVINQPIFSKRAVKTSVSILDGETIALGGLIREDVQKVNDKVPLLGDLPLVGRLFRSNVDQHIKKNLTIFVTVRLIDAAGQPVNSKEALEDSGAAPVPNLTEPSLPLVGR